MDDLWAKSSFIGMYALGANADSNDRDGYPSAPVPDDYLAKIKLVIEFRSRTLIPSRLKVIF